MTQEMPLAQPARRLVGLPPVVGPGTRVLVLGSFPGVASLAAQQYYGHPQNHFWRILAALWPQHPLPGRDQYAARCDWLLARGLGLWDVYAACEREGSLDTRIRNAQVNDFAGLQARAPHLAAIAHNGGESFRHAKAVRASLGACRTWSAESENQRFRQNRPQRAQFLPDLQPNSRAIGQKAGEKWAAAVDLQSVISKSDRLLVLEDGAPMASLRLPSTSPANASWSFEQKLSAWGDALAHFGLV